MRIKTNNMKKEIRIVGIDDASFDKFKDRETLVIGTFFRGGNFLDGVLSTKIKVDGTDSTERIARMINRSRFNPQLQAIFLNGIAVGGFNVIDIKKLSRKTKLPVIVVIRRYPDFRKIFNALKKLKMHGKIRLIEQAGKPIRMNKVYVQLINITEERAKRMLDIACTRSYIPEPIRIAHLIGQGVILGESRGNA